MYPEEAKITKTREPKSPILTGKPNEDVVPNFAPFSVHPIHSQLLPLYLPPSPKVVIPKFSDVLAFSGPAPERINGRIAMVGFVAALAVELSKGQDVFAQISNGRIPLLLGTSILIAICGLFGSSVEKGVSVESKSKGVMTSDAELWHVGPCSFGLHWVCEGWNPSVDVIVISD